MNGMDDTAAPLGRGTTCTVPLWLQFCLCLALGMVLSLIDGTDANWDLQNYHLYDPWALLHARLGADYYAAAYQSYFNPLADLPYFIIKCLAFPAWPRLVALLAGIPYGLLVFLVLRLSARFVTGHWTALLAALLGLTGATTLSEVGTSFNDILIADFLLAAMLCLLAEGKWTVLAAGCLCGTGIALKLTAGLFAPPLVLMAFVLPGQRWTRLVLFGTGAATGFLLAYGWWGWLLWRHFGNPFYPMFGTLFASPWAMPVSGQDTRFFPKTTLQWLAYPFFWLQGRPYVAAELNLRDPRFAFAYVAAAAAFAGWLSGRRPRRQTLALWLFIISGYVIWLCGFSILRYALPLEVLSGVFIATALQTLWPSRRIALPLALLAIFSLAFTEPMGWGRISYSKALISAPLPHLPAGTLLLTWQAPVGFVLPYLKPAPAHIVGVHWANPGSPEWNALQTLLRGHPPVWLLTNVRVAQADLIGAALAPLGLHVTGNACLAVHSPLQPSIELCPLSAAR